MELTFLPGEVFYGGAVTDGIRQPYTRDMTLTLDLTTNPSPNQMMPLLLSTAGRWLWNPDGMQVDFQNGRISCTPGTRLGQTGGTLGDAYRDAVAQCFPFREAVPDVRLFSAPVYNTWIPLTFHQSQQGVLEYAQGILDSGLPSGVLMIDDGWSDYYGKWTFSKEKFPNPEQMLQKLRDMGFSVMVWLCPFITPDTQAYRHLEKQGLLVTNGQGDVHIAHWWNGWSAVLDMTKEAARAWLKQQLDGLQGLGVVGFKFDAGDIPYYPADGPVSPEAHSRAWAAFGEQYPMNEYRVTTGAGGWGLMQRLCDKDPAWGQRGLQALIPDAIVQSLTGHPYLCPDMIGGGEYTCFLDLQELDQDLVVRWAQTAALMPVMQFSAAPWKVLSPENFARVQRAVALRQQYTPLLLELVAQCRRTGEPILRPLAYQFPEPECYGVTDQFLVGDQLLVAPILEKNATGRAVYLPKGVWTLENGEQICSPGRWYTLEYGENLGVFVYKGGE